ncbi:zinc finger BED domain-containing protein RICESLEEPER 1-like [Hordeum vulgare]|nr:zinc finger BED domain-containing protein RICESLEEPER 1-like [Hordeum vulgare]
MSGVGVDGEARATAWDGEADADLEEHKGTTERLRAIKIEKASGPDLEDGMGAPFDAGADKYLTMVKNAMKILFAEYASEFENTSNEGDELVEEDEEDDLDDSDNHSRLKRSHNSNELEQYLEEDLFPRRQKFDIFKWWKIHSPKYPVLGAIARDILAMSASIVHADATFSNARRIISDHRSSLSPTTIETLMCHEDWL